MRWQLVFCSWLAMVAPAVAHPPEPDSEDAKVLGPYKGWVADQHDMMGRWCCDIGDGTLAETRATEDGHLEVRAIHPGGIRGIPEGWHPVPEGKVVDVKLGGNPTGLTIVWFYNDRVQCLALGNEG